MSLKVPDQGELDLLSASLNIADKQEDLVLKLYKNDKTPADGDTAANYTEADFTGYAAYPIYPGDWEVTAGNPTTAEHPTVTFESSSGGQAQNVYGYFVVGADSGRLKWAERFDDGPYDIVNLGDKIEVQPRLTGQSEA